MSLFTTKKPVELVTTKPHLFKPSTVECIYGNMEDLRLQRHTPKLTNMGEVCCVCVVMGGSQDRNTHGNKGQLTSSKA